MKAKLLAWAERFDALARRERALLAAAVVVGIVLLGYALLIEPLLDAARADASRSEQARAALAELQTQLAALNRRVDPDADNRKALAAARERLAEGDARLKALEEGMVPPDKMRGFVEALLTRHRQITLVGLRTLPPTPVLEDAAVDRKAMPDAKSPQANIYKHGIEVRIAGRYEDLVAYLAELEQMPQKILWNKAALSAETYPRSVLTLTIYTLSLDKEWLTL